MQNWCREINKCPPSFFFFFPFKPSRWLYLLQPHASALILCRIFTIAFFSQKTVPTFVILRQHAFPRRNKHSVAATWWSWSNNNYDSESLSGHSIRSRLALRVCACVGCSLASTTHLHPRSSRRRLLNANGNANRMQNGWSEYAV